jgi:hypothetical protein
MSWREFVNYLSEVFGKPAETIESCLLKAIDDSGVSQNEAVEILREHYGVDYLSYLPHELAMILQGVDAPTLIAYCSTSKRLRETCEDPHLWSALLARDFGFVSEVENPKELYSKMGLWEYNVCSLITANEYDTLKRIVEYGVEVFWLTTVQHTITGFSLDVGLKNLKNCVNLKRDVLRGYSTYSLDDIIWTVQVAVMVKVLVELPEQLSLVTPTLSVYISIIYALKTTLFYNQISGTLQLIHIMGGVSNLFKQMQHGSNDQHIDAALRQTISQLQDYRDAFSSKKGYRSRMYVNLPRANPLYPRLESNKNVFMIFVQNTLDNLHSHLLLYTYVVPGRSRLGAIIHTFLTGL